LFDQNLKIASVCPVCSNRYNPVEIKVLAEKNNSHLIYIKCRKCQASVLAVMMFGNLGVTSVGMITDLSSDDILRLASTKAVDTDDVLEMHQFLVKEKALIDQFK